MYERELLAQTSLELKHYRSGQVLRFLRILLVHFSIDAALRLKPNQPYTHSDLVQYVPCVMVTSVLVYGVLYSAGSPSNQLQLLPDRSDVAFRHPVFFSCSPNF